MTNASSSANPSADDSGASAEGCGFVDYKEMIMKVCGSTSMAAAKKAEIRGLLESLHNIHTGVQEGLVKAQHKLIRLLEDHTTLKDELSRTRAAANNMPDTQDPHSPVTIGSTPGGVRREGALVWVSGGDASSEDKSTERRIDIVNRIGAKGEVMITDSFFSRDGKLGLRVSDADRSETGDAARALGFETKVLGEFEPELFIRD
ncbi:hypothetical protein FOZ63_015309, partial [Perkinsus olseni]